MRAHAASTRRCGMIFGPSRNTPFLDERFADRHDAGRRLASALAASGYDRARDVVVLALPRGGVPVGYEVATRLNVPLDVFLVRKLGVARHEELAMGAVASGGVTVLNDDVVHRARIQRHELEAVMRSELRELDRRERAYRGERPTTSIEGKTAILVDDGLATGASMRAAAEAVRRRDPGKVVVAVPVGARETCAQFRQIVDDVICPVTPEQFASVGMWYEDFSQTSDDEVRELLERAEREHVELSH
jgi:predicted phosphoribosyltransferase